MFAPMTYRQLAVLNRLFQGEVRISELYTAAPQEVAVLHGCGMITDREEATTPAPTPGFMRIRPAGVVGRLAANQRFDNGEQVILPEDEAFAASVERLGRNTMVS